MKKIKVLHFISSIGLFGAENVVLLLGANCDRGMVESKICALVDARNPVSAILDRARELGIPTIRIEGGGRFDASVILELKRVLGEERVDVLHTHNYKSDLLGLAAARLSGVPVVATAHGFTDMTQAVSGYESVDRFVLRRLFDKVVTVSEKVLPGCADSRKKVIPNGVEIEKFTGLRKDAAAIREGFGFSPDDLVIGTVGRFSKEKNQGLLLRAFADVVKVCPRAKLFVVGDGPERERLKALTEELGLTPFVTYPGIIRDVARVYPAMDIFVLSSFTEGVPLTLLEAMASKVPVVATRVGGIPEIITDASFGVLVESQDQRGLADQLTELAADSGRRQRLAEEAFKVVQERHSIRSMCQAYEQIYQEMTA